MYETGIGLAVHSERFTLELAAVGENDFHGPARFAGNVTSRQHQALLADQHATTGGAAHLQGHRCGHAFGQHFLNLLLNRQEVGDGFRCFLFPSGHHGVQRLEQRQERGDRNNDFWHSHLW